MVKRTKVDAPAAAAAAVEENPLPVQSAPVEPQLDTALTSEASSSEVANSPPLEAQTGAVLAVDAGEGATLENPIEPNSAPTESQAAAVTEEAKPPEAPPVPPPAPASRETLTPPAVRTLPRRPRLRATFSYDAQDQLQLELTLLNERRELIHRTTLQPVPGSALARIFEALVGVAVQAAAQAGVFGSRQG